MNQLQLNRKLNALIKMPPMQFILQLKLKKARLLLLQTQRPVSEIAYACGFSDPSHFTKVFTRETTCSPREFREQFSKK